jgi:hypothetical protein
VPPLAPLRAPMMTVSPQGQSAGAFKLLLTSNNTCLWRNALRCGIVQPGKNVINNVIKSLLSLCTVNHTDSDMGYSKHHVQFCQSARLFTVQLAFP